MIHASSCGRPSMEVSSARTAHRVDAADQPTKHPSTQHTTASSQSPKTLARNRRKKYLEMNPAYFSADSLEHADPLLYDRLVRRWFTLAEVEQERQERGFSGMLEADLQRSEARVQAGRRGDLKLAGEDQLGRPRFIVDQDDADDLDRAEQSKEASWKLWVSEMTSRFIDGQDDQADYNAIDGNEDYDDIEQSSRDIEERYFDQEPVCSDIANTARLTGETGVQDF